MAARNMSNSAPFGAISILATINRADAALHAVSAWNNRRKTEKALGALSDHELNDIGLGRHDIGTFSNRIR